MAVELSDADLVAPIPRPRQPTQELSDADVQVVPLRPGAGTKPLTDDEVLTPDTGTRLGRRAGAAAMHGAAEVVRTLDLPGTLLMGNAPSGTGSPADVARWLDEHAPREDTGSTRAGRIADVTASVAGGFIPGAVEFAMGVPYAIAHGAQHAEEAAHAQGREPTAYEMAHDAIVEGVVRKFLGAIGARDMGRVTKGLGFAAGSGFQDVAEGRSKEDALIDAGINAIIGTISHNLTPGQRARVQEARDAAARGDGKAAMASLTPVLMDHADEIATIARNVAPREEPPPEAAPGEPSPPGPRPVGGPAPRAPAGPGPGGGEAGTGGRPPAPVEARGLGPPREPPPPEYGAPGPRGRWPGRDISDAATRVKRSIDALVSSTLAIRITQKEWALAQVRMRISAWENYFRGMPDTQRVDLISRYQKGGVEALPEAWRKPFQAIEQLMTDLERTEHAAGMDYELRQHYMAGFWQDPQQGQAYYFSNPSGVGRPAFTRAKVFDDYQEGVDAGLVPKTTNPAVIAAWRAEAGLSAVTRIKFMQDLVEDGLAIPIRSLTEQGVDLRLHSPFGPNPPQFAGGVQRMIGGTIYLVEPRAAQLLDMHLSSATQQLAQFFNVDPHGRAMTAAGKLGGVWMAFRNATIPVKLTLSAFHANHILGIDVFQPFSAAMTEFANKRIGFEDFLTAIREGSGSVEKEAYGRHLTMLFDRDPATLSPLEQVEVNLMLAGGFFPQRPSIYETRATEQWRRTFNDILPSLEQQLDAGGASALARMWKVSPVYARAAVLLIGRGTEALQGPLFRDWIPSLKAAAYLNQAKLVLASRPELLRGTWESNQQARMALRQVRLSIDSRFGEFQYDKLLMPAVIRRALMGSMLSMAWNFGFLREFGGAFHDAGEYARNFTKPAQREVTTRMVYAATYLAGSLIVGGLMTALMTGQAPQSMNDLIYPRMPDGSRLSTPFFTREFGAMYYRMAEEGPLRGLTDFALSKQAPLMTSLMESLNNADYYGHQVRDPNAGWLTNFAEGAEHVGVGSLSPISVQAYLEGKVSEGPQMALAVGGFNPAPGYVEKPGVVGKINAAYHSQHPVNVIPYAEVERHDEVRAISKAYREAKKKGDHAAMAEADRAFGDYARAHPQYGGKHGSAFRLARRSWDFPDAALEFRSLDRATQRRIMKEASPDERKEYLPFAHPDIRSEFR